MIGKSKAGKGFRGVLDYCLGKEKGHIIDQHAVEGSSARELAAGFRESWELNQRVESPVWHVSLSLDQGEHLSDDQWSQVARRYLNEMGYTANQWVAIKHEDTTHGHIHIVASKVRMDNGKVVNGWQDQPRSQRVLRGIERDYGLRSPQMSQEVGRKAPTRDEIAMVERTGQDSLKMTLQGAVDASKAGKPTLTAFKERLEALGVDLVANVQSTGRVSGISFKMGDQVMKGSALGKKYSWANLAKEIDYEPSRDHEAIRGRKAAEPGREVRPIQPVEPAMGTGPGGSAVDHAGVPGGRNQIRHGEQAAAARVERIAKEVLKRGREEAGRHSLSPGAEVWSHRGDHPQGRIGVEGRLDSGFSARVGVGMEAGDAQPTRRRETSELLPAAGAGDGAGRPQRWAVQPKSVGGAAPEKMSELLAEWRKSYANTRCIPGPGFQLGRTRKVSTDGESRVDRAAREGAARVEVAHRRARRTASERVGGLRARFGAHVGRMLERAKELGKHTQGLVRDVLQAYPAVAKTIAKVAPAPVLKALNISTSVLRDRENDRGWSR